MTALTDRPTASSNSKGAVPLDVLLAGLLTLVVIPAVGAGIYLFFQLIGEVRELKGRYEKIDPEKLEQKVTALAARFDDKVKGAEAQINGSQKALQNFVEEQRRLLSGSVDNNLYNVKHESVLAARKDPKGNWVLVKDDINKFLEKPIRIVHISGFYGDADYRLLIFYTTK